MKLEESHVSRLKSNSMLPSGIVDYTLIEYLNTLDLQSVNGQICILLVETTKQVSFIAFAIVLIFDNAICSVVKPSR